ncbi:MAG TPA: dicarboxylate/amino acid:cation symporter [Pyrinomonadaceae bacterium]|nr:dicarboxylate/amino acid:cation symporter [Pyrinomonadaceae bacterium]
MPEEAGIKWYRKLHWQIIIGLVLGLIYGVIAAANGWGLFTRNWIAPFGTIFLNLLKLIAVPLVLASLITGVASLSDLRKLSRIGGKTIAIYIATTVVAVTLGLVIVNVLRPGDSVPPGMRDQLQSAYERDVETQTAAAEKTKQRGPLQMFVDMVPENFFGSAGDNRNMLQIVFVAILFGIGLIQVSPDKSRPVLAFFEGLNDVIIRLVDVVMLMAPLGVFALIAGTITTVAQDNLAQVVALLGALGFYCIAVIAGLSLHTFFTYPLMLKLFSPMGIKKFFAGIGPAQLVAFSTSSSGATLPVTMERCEEELGVSEEVSSFVLPLGATINMDGTALYQAIAAVFIAQALGMGLGITAQLTIVLTAVLASIGTAAVPGAGIIMLVIILEAIAVPSAGIALILGVDRILDMMRTVTNVTGDATVATIVAASENQLWPTGLPAEADRLRISTRPSEL